LSAGRRGLVRVRGSGFLFDGGSSVGGEERVSGSSGRKVDLMGCSLLRHGEND
jgi:hypothetical protein